MSGSGKNGSNGRRSGRRRDKEGPWNEGAPGQQSGGQQSGRQQGKDASRQGGDAPRKGESVRQRRRGGDGGKLEKKDKNRGGPERLKWTPPKLSTEPLPAPDCPLCGKPVRDLAAALAEKGSGAPVHFECALGAIARDENPGKGETVAYIGGGRFGVLRFIERERRERREKREGRRRGAREPRRNEENRTFSISKILEWEDKDNRALWRADVSDHYSVT